MIDKLTFPLSVIAFFGLSPNHLRAQDFDPMAFEKGVNEALAEVPGVTFKLEPSDLDNKAATFGTAYSELEWVEQAIKHAPDFGFVVTDANGSPVDILSGDVPYKTVGEKIDIAGYNLPAGFSVMTVGKAGYVEAVSEIANKQIVAAPSSDVEQAIQTVKAASSYITQELCSASGRPTEIILNLTAGFKLAFSVETGSKFTWDLEIVCKR